ncbi:hypothetical protein BH11CYA1_BH11CYA1_07530 [soil metagenome]
MGQQYTQSSIAVAFKQSKLLKAALSVLLALPAFNSHSQALASEETRNLIKESFSQSSVDAFRSGKATQLAGFDSRQVYSKQGPAPANTLSTFGTPEPWPYPITTPGQSTLVPGPCPMTTPSQSTPIPKTYHRSITVEWKNGKQYVYTRDKIEPYPGTVYQSNSSRNEILKSKLRRAPAPEQTRGSRESRLKISSPAVH